MPTVPRLNESKVLEQRSPIQGIDTSGSRAIGEGMIAFGQGVQRAAQGALDLYRADQLQKERNKSISLLEAEADAKELGQRLRAERLGDPNRDKRGDDLVPRFQEEWEPGASAIADRYQNDPETHRLVRAKVKEVGVAYREELFDRNRELRVQDDLRRTEQLMNAKVAEVYRNPERFDESRKNLYTNIDMLKSLGVPSDKIDAARQDLSHEMAINYVQGLANKGDYDGARKALLDPATGVAPMVKAKELNNLSLSIDQLEMARINQKWTLTDRKRQLEKIQLDKTQQENFLNLLGSTFDNEQVEKNAKILYSAGQISDEQYRTFTGVKKTQADTTSDAAKAMITIQATDARNKLDDVRNNTIKLMNDIPPGQDQPLLSFQAGSELIKMIDTMQKDRHNRNADPAFKARMEAAKGIINAKFKTYDPILGSITKPDDDIRRANAIRVFVDEVYLRGRPIDEAREKALNAYPNRLSIGDVQSVQGLDQADYSNPTKDKAGNYVVVQKAIEEYRKNKDRMDKRSQADALRKIKDLRDYLDKQQGAK